MRVIYLFLWFYYDQNANNEQLPYSDMTDYFIMWSPWCDSLPLEYMYMYIYSSTSICILWIVFYISSHLISLFALLLRPGIILGFWGSTGNQSQQPLLCTLHNIINGWLPSAPLIIWSFLPCSHIGCHLHHHWHGKWLLLTRKLNIKHLLNLFAEAHSF